MNRKSISATLLGTVLLFAASCTTIEKPPERQIIRETQVSYKNYVLNQVAEATLGNSVIRVKNYSIAEVASNRVEVTSDFLFEGPIWSHQFRKGDVFPLAGAVEYDGSKFYVAKIDSQRGVLFDDTGQVFHKMIANVEGATFVPPVFVAYSYTTQPPGPHLRRIVTQKRSSASANGKNYEIVFAGLTPDSIHLTYREYTADGSGRAAISQDLIYPRTAQTIRFRNLMIELVGATPDSLRYKVVAE